MIRVNLLKLSGSHRTPYWYAAWVNPATGRKQRKSLKTANKAEARVRAAALEEELRSAARGEEPATELTARRVSWRQFRDEFKVIHLSSLKASTERRYYSALNNYEWCCQPVTVDAVTTASVQDFVSIRLKEEVERSTIQADLNHLSAAINWAEARQMIARAPKIPKVPRVRSQRVAKGRSISLEELERMQHATEEACKDPDTAKGYRDFILGLWLSGLRLDEAVSLSWDDARAIVPLLDGRFPTFNVPASAEKGNRDRVLAMAPEFAEFLRSIPEPDRHGYVFDLPQRRKVNGRLSSHWIGEMVSRCGRIANVRVSQGSQKLKFASAHDLRRAFGTRWATRVMPPILKELMRHENIATTLKYYGDLEAEKTAGVAGEAYEAAQQRSPSREAAEYR